MKKILIATGNTGKIMIYSTILKELGLKFCTLKDIKVNIDVEETGSTTEENAKIKALAYYNATGMPTLSNDSGLTIEKLAPEDQPGIFVRRYQGRELTDEETIKIFSKKLHEVGGSSSSYFDVSLALVDAKGILHSRNFKSFRLMVENPSNIIVPRLPLRSLDYDPVSKRYMSEMTIEEANAFEGDCLKQQKKFIKEVFSKND